MTSMCKFTPRCGYTTSEVRKEFFNVNGVKDTRGSQSGRELSVDQMTANLDRTKPLYYWQLYSLLGKEPIWGIVRNFYGRVFSDEQDPEFREAFTRIANLEHHIETQSAFWQDAFGGGRQYHGSNYRLKFHHSHNAKQVMNEAGAKRWMYHMGNTLQEFDPILRAIDPRIPGCIVDFLRTKMKTYSDQFGWTYAEGDFDVAKAQHPDVSLTTINVDVGATIVYGRRELECLSVQALRSISKNLAVSSIDLSHCIEKRDIIGAIAQTGKVSIVEPPTYTLTALNAQRIGTLKEMARLVGVDVSRCVEKQEIIRALSGSKHVAIVEHVLQAEESFKK
jgi:truncated hemoglobin YjbI